MKKALIGLAATAVAAIATFGASPAGAQQAATITLLHGIPGATVDVAVNGQVVIPNFAPGATQDLSSFAGQTLTNVEVRTAGSTTVVIGPIPSLAVPASGNVTVVAHLTETGTPTLTPFVNDVSPTPAGQGRLTVRHTAAAPAVDIVVGTARPITNLSNPNEAKLTLPAGPLSGAKIAPTGGAPIADVPAVNIEAGKNLIVYAVGSLSGNTFTYLTQSITTGEAGSLPDTGAESLPLALVGALVAGAGIFMVASTRARRTA
jgi:LPXTG-motif cell wall-anchored protein